MDEHSVKNLRGTEPKRFRGPSAGLRVGGGPHQCAVQVGRHPHCRRRVARIFLRRVQDGEIGQRRGEVRDKVGGVDAARIDA